MRTRRSGFLRNAGRWCDALRSISAKYRGDFQWMIGIHRKGIPISGASIANSSRWIIHPAGSRQTRLTNNGRRSPAEHLPEKLVCGVTSLRSWTTHAESSTRPCSDYHKNSGVSAGLLVMYVAEFIKSNAFIPESAVESHLSDFSAKSSP